MGEIPELTETLHYPPYQCESGEVRIHNKCGGTVILKEYGNCYHSRLYCLEFLAKKLGNSEHGISKYHYATFEGSIMILKNGVSSGTDDSDQETLIYSGEKKRTEALAAKFKGGG